MNPDLFIFAGEASGDRLGDELLQALFEIKKDLSVFAVAGERMRKHPISCLMETEKFQQMGFFSLVKSAIPILKNYYFLKKWILKNSPKVAVFIDFPEFSLRLEESLKKEGFKGKIIHYVCPTIWAWRKNRLKRMNRSIDHLLTLFPFEQEFLQGAHFSSQFIGHPLAYQIQKNQFSSLAAVPSLGLFPGSREQEILLNLPIQLRVVKSLLIHHPNLPLFLSIASSNIRPLIEFHLKMAGLTKKIILWHEKPYEMMSYITTAIATSGTICLELALHSIPTVVTYGIRPFDLFLAQKIFKISLPYYCIVNILQEKEVFPELYGPNLNEKRLFLQVSHLLCDESTRQECISHCQLIKKMLTTPNPSVQAAETVLSFLSS